MGAVVCFFCIACFRLKSIYEVLLIWSQSHVFWIGRVSMSQISGELDFFSYQRRTPPKALTFNSLPLKHDDWKTILSFWNAPFSGAMLNFVVYHQNFLEFRWACEVKSVFRDILAEEAHNNAVSSRTTLLRFWVSVLHYQHVLHSKAGQCLKVFNKTSTETICSWMVTFLFCTFSSKRFCILPQLALLFCPKVSSEKAQAEHVWRTTGREASRTHGHLERYACTGLSIPSEANYFLLERSTSGNG